MKGRTAAEKPTAARLICHFGGLGHPDSKKRTAVGAPSVRKVPQGGSCRVIGRHALRVSTGREAVDLDFGGQNPMLVITVDRGLTAPAIRFRRSTRTSFLPRSLTGASLRRHKLHIPRPAVNGRSRSFRCASSPHKILDFAGTPFFGGES